MSSQRKGITMACERCWIPHPTEVWGVAVPVGKASTGVYQLVEITDETTTDALTTVTLSEKDMQKVSPITDARALAGIDNVCDLADVSEASILHTVRVRFSRDQIYTNVGRVVLALNPFIYLPMYSLEQVQEYYKAPHPYSLRPHLFQVSAAAVKGLLERSKPQSTLITGESGAGKTESTKLILQFLADVSEGCRNRDGGVSGRRRRSSPTFSGSRTFGGKGGMPHVQESGGGAAGSLTQRVLEISPILESFGNASTSRNPNSSRFGKWIEVFFNDASAEILGARITSYLLELPRVTRHVQGERSYHVFYQLATGLTSSDLVGVAASFKLGNDISAFEILKPQTPNAPPGKKLQQGVQENAVARKHVDDLEGFAELKRALLALNFEPSAQNEIFSIVAALLHIGNVQFSPASGPDNSEGCKLADETSAEHLRTASSLLGLDSSLTERLFTSRAVRMGAENITMVLKPEQAEGARDSFSKLVYGLLFGWLIERINANLSPSTTAKPAQSSRFIGILDIAGFESFQVNGFEQLCINLSNEELQHQFNEDIFLTELKDYTEEGITGLEISYEDNADILDLVAGKGGILAMLDEELFVPKGSEQGFMSKLNKAHSSNRRFLQNRIQGSLSFGIQHYAGPVTYTVDGWLVKNQNAPPAEAMACLLSASRTVVKSMAELVSTEDSTGTKKTPGAATGGPKGSGAQSRKTVGGSFKRELAALTAKIKSTDTHYVRCVKPNPRHEPKAFNSNLAFRQLVCSGVLEAVRIRQSGFSLRVPHADFVQRYSIIAGTRVTTLLKRESSPKEAAEKLVAHLVECKGVSSTACVIGKTKVLAKARVQDALDQAREVALADPAIRIQAAYRGYRTWKQGRLLFDVYEKVKPLLSAGEEAAKRGGFLGDLGPVFADAVTAAALQDKALHMEEHLAQLQSLDATLQPATLPALVKIYTKMVWEANILLEIERLLHLLQPCGEVPTTEKQTKVPENVDEVSRSLADAVQKARNKNLTSALLEVAAARVERIESERRLSNQLETALQSQEKSALKALIDEAHMLAKTSPPAASGAAADGPFAAGVFFTPYLPTLVAAAEAALQEDARAAARLAAERAAAEKQLQEAALRRQQETTVRDVVVAEHKRSHREVLPGVAAVGDLFAFKENEQYLPSGRITEDTKAPGMQEGDMRRIPLQRDAAARLSTSSPSSSEWTDSSDEEDFDEDDYSSRRSDSWRDEDPRAGRAPAVLPAAERGMESRYMRKFARELARASAECDVAQIQFLLDRAQEAGLATEKGSSYRDILREQRVAQQQLQNLQDPFWLSVELREAVVSLTWGAPTQKQLARLQNLVNQATALNSQSIAGEKHQPREESSSGTARGTASGDRVDPESLRAAVAVLDSLRGQWRYGAGAAVSPDAAAAAASDNEGGVASEEGHAAMLQKAYELESFPLLRINKLIEQTSSGRKLERLLARRTELLSHQSEPLQESLLLLEDPGAEAVALNCFRDLLGAVGDRFCVGRSSLGEEVVQLGTRPSTPSEMRDEIYCQILKQLRGNPSVAGMLACLRLLQSCCQTFPPSLAFEPFLRHALLQQQTLAAAAAARLVGRQKVAASNPSSLLQLQQELEHVAREALADLDTTTSRARKMGGPAAAGLAASSQAAGATTDALSFPQAGGGSFHIQIRLSDGSRRRVFLGFENAHSLTLRVLKELDLVLGNEWGIMEEVPEEELKPLQTSGRGARGRAFPAAPSLHEKAISSAVPPPASGSEGSQEARYQYLRLLPEKSTVREYLESKATHQVKLFLLRTVFRLEETLSVHPTNARLIYRQALQQFLDYLYLNEDVQLIAAISAHILHVETLVKTTATRPAAKRLTWNEICWTIPQLLRSCCTEDEWCRLVEEALEAFDFADGELAAMAAAFQLMKRLTVFGGYFWRADEFPLAAEQLPGAASRLLRRYLNSALSSSIPDAALQELFAEGGKCVEGLTTGQEKDLSPRAAESISGATRSTTPARGGGSTSWLQRLLCRPAATARSAALKEGRGGDGGRRVCLSRRKKRLKKPYQEEQQLLFSFRGSVWLAVDVRGIHVFSAQTGAAGGPTRAPTVEAAETAPGVNKFPSLQAAASAEFDSVRERQTTDSMRKRCRSSLLGEDSVPISAAQAKNLRTISPEQLWLVTSLPPSDNGRRPDLVLIGSFLAGRRPHLQAFLTQVPAQDVVGLMLLYFPHCLVKGASS